MVYILQCYPVWANFAVADSAFKQAHGLAQDDTAYIYDKTKLENMANARKARVILRMRGDFHLTNCDLHIIAYETQYCVCRNLTRLSHSSVRS